MVKALMTATVDCFYRNKDGTLRVWPDICQPYVLECNHKTLLRALKRRPGAPIQVDLGDVGAVKVEAHRVYVNEVAGNAELRLVRFRDRDGSEMAIVMDKNEVDTLIVMVERGLDLLAPEDLGRFLEEEGRD